MAPEQACSTNGCIENTEIDSIAPMPLSRTEILPEASLPDSAELISRGQELSRDWKLDPGPFLKTTGFAFERRLSRRGTFQITERDVMLHVSRSSVTGRSRAGAGTADAR